MIMNMIMMISGPFSSILRMRELRFDVAVCHTEQIADVLAGHIMQEKRIRTHFAAILILACIGAE